MLDQNEYYQAYLYVLLNCDEVDPYVSQFDSHFCEGLRHHEIQNIRAGSFIPWFRDAVNANMFEPDEYVRHLARGPNYSVNQHRGYKVNGYKFHTSAYGKRKGTTNSGVRIRGTVTGTEEDSDFYGVLEDVIELDFCTNRVILFKCMWFDTTTSRGWWKHPKYGLVEVNPNRRYPLTEPFVLASQAQQVYYTTIPGLRRGHERRNWWAVFTTRARHVIDGITQLAGEDSDVSSDDDDEVIPNARGTVFQDNHLPPLQLDYNATSDYDGEADHRIATGHAQLVHELIDLRPAAPPTEADLFNLDQAEELHDTDSESD